MQTNLLKFSFISILLSCSLSALATIIPNQDGVEINYTLNESDFTAVVIAKEGGYEGNVAIPDKVQYEGSEYTVTEIEKGAFRDCAALEYVNLPENLSKIGMSAFWACKSLKEISLPSSLTAIPSSCFSQCESLQSIEIPEGVASLGGCAFSLCTALENVILPKSLNEIGDNVFICCDKLTTICNYSLVKLGRGLYGIGNSALFIYNDMEIDGDYIYTYVHSDPELGRYLGNATELTLPEKIADKSYSIGEYAFCNDSTLVSLTTPDNLISIKADAFYNCKSLKSISIPKGQSCIEAGTFLGCKSLDEVILPENLVEIKSGAFAVCESLTNINIPASVTALGEKAFYGCSSLESINLPDAITDILNSTFYNCTSLKSVILPDSLIKIGESAFYNCKSLEEITLPENLTKIGDNAFYGCTNLKRVYNNSSLFITYDRNKGNIGYYAEKIYTDVFIDNNFIFERMHTDPILSDYDGEDPQILVLPRDANGLPYSIGFNFKYYKPSVEEIILPDTIVSINDRCFSAFYGVCLLRFPQATPPVLNGSPFPANMALAVGAPVVDDYKSAWTDYKWQVVIDGETDFDVNVSANDNASAVLKAITNGKADSYAYNAVNLKVSGTINSYDVLVFREKLLNLHHLDLSEANFVDCEFCWDGSNHTVDNEIAKGTFDGMSKLFSLKLPETTKSIGDRAIASCTNLRSLTIPNSVTTIGASCLNNCSNLTSLTLSDQLESVGAYAFANLWIENLDLPDGITYMGGHAFENCKWLKSIKLPQSLENISEWTFNNCSALESVEFGANLKGIGESAFLGCSNLTEAIIPNNVEIISTNAFYECHSLKHVVFPRKLKEIGRWAFNNCYSLADIQLPTRLTKIESGAFYNCQSLTEIKLPASLSSLGMYVFTGCTNVKSIYSWTIAPIKADLSTFDQANFEEATLYVPEAGQSLYYYNSDWLKFRILDTFNQPYEYFYLDGDDLVLDDGTVRIDGENGANPDADLSGGSGLIVEGNVSQDLGEVTVDNTSSLISHDSDDANINIEMFVTNIPIQRDRWYFFCFPFDVPKENIHYNGLSQWCYYDGEARANNGQGGWQDVPENVDLQANKGYIFIGSKDGILQIFQQNVSLAPEDRMIALESYPSTSSSDASWNLIGNPYTSYYNLADLGYNAPITFWNPNTRTYEAYNPEDDDIVLYPYQAFFVQKPEDAEGVGFENEYQETYQQTQNEENRMAAQRRRLARARTDVERFICNIEVNDGICSDRTRVVFNENSAIAYEIGKDASKFMSSEAPQLYTLDNTNVRYSINERPVAEGAVRLGFTAQQGGTYTISASRLDTPLYLIDLATGTSTDLACESYEFDAARGTIDNRFVLSTEPSLTALRDKMTDSDTEYIYYDLRGINHGHDLPAGLSIRQDGTKRVKLAE